MSMQDEKDFEVVDKRRVNTEESTEENREPCAEPQPPEESAPRAEETHEEPLPPVEVGTVLSVFIQQLQGLAWMRMGLVADPLSGQIEKDMAQAKMAIDGVAALVDVVSPTLSETDRRDLQVMVSNLRVNFVRQQ